MSSLRLCARTDSTDPPCSNNEFNMSPGTLITIPVVIAVVISVFVIALGYYCKVRMAKKRRREYVTVPEPTVRRTITAVVVTITEDSNVPMARESDILQNAELVMPSISAQEDFANIPVAAAQSQVESQVETADLPAVIAICARPSRTLVSYL